MLFGDVTACHRAVCVCVVCCVVLCTAHNTHAALWHAFTSPNNI